MNKPVKMRSSIACVRCRRSKVKCVNNGMNTTCRTCESQGRECTYPAPTIGTNTTPKRSEATGGLRPDGEVEIKRVRKKEPDTARKPNYRNAEDPLETFPITFAQWKEIYSLFMLHFSTDLPFLHEATFFDRIIKSEESRSPGTQILLLGILSLTARFVPELVACRDYPPLRTSNPSSSDPKPGQPLYASEFYAHALEDRLDAVTMATPSLDTIQGLLMLGLYSWGMCRGTRSWMWIGIATRMAYAMGLSSEELPSHTSGKNDEVERELKILGLKEKPSSSIDTQGLVLREIKRRTMWSCFMLDRYLSSGRSRPQISVNSIKIQLPCSEEDFRFGSNVHTDFLKAGGGVEKVDSSSGNGHLTQVESSPVLGLYIRLTEIWGGISKWSCEGGRREEKFPPWKEKCRFYVLRQQLADYQASLPPKLTFTPSNLAAHVGGTAMSAYTTIHALYHLCEIVLHREYIPFIPLRCPEGPSGPLDEPLFPKERYKPPHKFWEESAEHVFKSARAIIEIVKANETRKYLIEAPLAMFAIWTATFVGLYATNFPWMDPGRYMCDSPISNYEDVPNHGGQEASRLALNSLGRMKEKMPQAVNWHKVAAKFNRYFKDIKEHHHNGQLLINLRLSQNGVVTEEARKLSLRDGGHGMGGGLAVYKIFEKDLKEFGTIDEDDEPSESDRHEQSSSRASTSGPGTTPNIKSEAMQGVEKTYTGRPNSEGTWAAVNTGTMNGGDGYGQRPTPMSYKPLGPAPQGHSGARQDFSYEQGLGGIMSHTPSLIGGHNTHPTPSNLSSPNGQSDLATLQPSDSTFPNDSQQHSQQMAAYPSSAQHTQPLLGSPPDQVGFYYDQSRHQNIVDEANKYGWGGDIHLFREATPYNQWPADIVHEFPSGNFIQAVIPPHPSFSAI